MVNASATPTTPARTRRRTASSWEVTEPARRDASPPSSSIHAAPSRTRQRWTWVSKTEQPVPAPFNASLTRERPIGPRDRNARAKASGPTCARSPIVGGGGTDEEERLASVLRRLLDQPALELAVTRVRVPIFVGSLAALHIDLAKPLESTRAEALLSASPAIDVLRGDDLPSPRGASGRDQVVVGRIRCDGTGLALVLAQDDLRRGAALSAVETVEMRLADA